MLIKTKFVAAIIIASSIFVIIAQATRCQAAASAPTTAATPAPIAEINRRYEDRVAAAKKRSDQLIAEAAQSRLAALKQLLKTAMAEKNLNLANAAQAEITRIESPATAPSAPATAPSRAFAKIVLSARIDGTDEVTFNSHGVKWKHGAWGLPADVTINGVKMDLQQSTEWPNAGETQFLPFAPDFNTARVVSRSGRDVVALEKSEDEMVVKFADTEGGADEYSITIEVQAALPPAETAR